MAASSLFRFGEFELDAAQRRLRRGGDEVPLQPKVYETLLYLVERSQRVVSKEELLASIWPDAYVTENALSRCIREIRRALDDDAHSPVFVKTVPRVGFQFVAPLAAETPPAAERPSRRSIAVVPFRSLGGHRDEGLEMGMADTLITRLSRTRQLLVRPLGATRRYAGASLSPRQIGRQHATDLVVDGGIQRAADRLRVTVRLTSVRDGHTVWAEQFDHSVDEVFALQDAICGGVVDALGMELSAPERQRVDKQPTASPEAYRSYLLGRLHFGKHTPAATQSSIEAFEKALDLDPAYALAWAGLAESYETLGTQGIQPAEHSERARRAATRARALDPELAEPLRCLAKIAWQYDWEWDEADRLFNQAIELDPNNSETRIAYSDYCCYLRRPDDGEVQARAALALDPISPWINTLLAQALHMQGRHEEAVSQAERTLEIDPDFAFARFFAGLASVVAGSHDEGIAHLEAAVESSGRLDFASALGWAFSVAGQPDRTRSLLAEMRERAASEPVPPICFVLLHAGLGEFDTAFEALDRCVEERTWHVLLIYSEPAFASLLSDPRAHEMIRHLGLPAIQTDGSAEGVGESR